MQRETPLPSATTPVSVRTVMSGLMLVILLGSLEQTIVAVAAPVISSQLRGFELIAWVVAAYLVASTAATPVLGRLSDIYGRRAMLSFAIALFFGASAGCASAKSLPQLIFFRALQGIGGGGLISMAQATIADIVPLRERGRYQGYISGVFAFASLAGPMVGGALTQYLSWRWIFWINLPLAAIAMAVVRVSLRGLPVIRAARRIDYLGAVLFTGGLTAFLIAVTRIGHGEAMLSASNLTLLLAALTAFAIFVHHERQTAAPLIPLALLRNRVVAVCCLALFVGVFLFISLAVLLPLQSQLYGHAQTDAALSLLPLTLAIPAGAFSAGRLMSKSGRYKPWQLGGSAAVTLAAFALAFCGPERAWAMTAALAVLGAGIGMQFPTCLVATQNAVPPSQIGVATALSSLARQLGGAVGVAVLTSILLALLSDALGSPVSADTLKTIQAADTGGRAAVAAAFRHLYLIAAGFSLLSPVLLSFLPEKELRGRS